MSKRDSRELDNTQPWKKQKMISKQSKEKSSSSIDMTGNIGSLRMESHTTQLIDDEEQDNDIDGIANISKIGNVSSGSFFSNLVQSIHILGNNTVELSHQHNKGRQKQVSQVIVDQLTQLMVSSNFRLVIPKIVKSTDNDSNSLANSTKNKNNDRSSNSNKNKTKSNDNSKDYSMTEEKSSVDNISEDNIEEITKNDQICHNKLSDWLKYKLENCGKMGQSKIREIEIKIEGFKGTRSNKFRSQSIANTPLASSSGNGLSLTINTNTNTNTSRSSVGSISSISSTNITCKNKTDRLICYRDEINEKLFEYCDIILVFPDDCFDVLLNLFEYLRLCELGRTRNTSNPLFSEGIDSMGKVLIFNLNGFYNGLNKQFNCYDEDKVENRFVVVVVDTIQEGIQRLKMWNRD